MPAITLASTPFLRLALLGDAVASAATSLLLAAAAGPLATPLGLPEPLLRFAGLVLLPYVVFVAWAGTRAAPSRWAVRAAITLNLLWSVDSALLLAFGPIAPTAFGIAFTLAQALAVLGFALAQWTASRRAGAALVVA